MDINNDIHVFSTTLYIKSYFHSISNNLKIKYFMSQEEREKLTTHVNRVINEIQSAISFGKLSDKDIKVLSTEVTKSLYHLIKAKPEKIVQQDIFLNFRQNLPNELKLFINSSIKYQKEIQKTTYYSKFNLKESDQIDFEKLNTQYRAISEFAIYLKDKKFKKLAQEHSKELNKCTSYSELLKLVQKINNDIDNKTREVVGKEPGGDDKAYTTVAFFLLIGNPKLPDAASKLESIIDSLKNQEEKLYLLNFTSSFMAAVENLIDQSQENV